MLARYALIVRVFGGWDVLGFTLLAEWLGATLGILLFHVQVRLCAR